MATAHPDHSLISSTDVEGTSVFDTRRNSIGSIDHLMIDKVSGNVRYAVISFGGLLGIGTSHYPLPWAAMRYDTALDGYVTSVSQEQLSDAPEFSDDSWMDRDWETRMHEHYGARPYWDDRASL